MIKVTFTVKATSPCQARTRGKQRFHRWMMNYPIEMFLVRCKAVSVGPGAYRVDMMVNAEGWEFEDERVTVLTP